MSSSSSSEEKKEVPLSQLRKGRMYRLKNQPEIHENKSKFQGWYQPRNPVPLEVRLKSFNMKLLSSRPLELISIEKNKEGQIETLIFSNPIDPKKSGIPAELRMPLLRFNITYFEDEEDEIFLDYGYSKAFLEMDWLVGEAFEAGTGKTGKRGLGAANDIRRFLQERSRKRHTNHPMNRNRDEFAYLFRSKSKRVDQRVNQRVNQRVKVVADELEGAEAEPPQKARLSHPKRRT